MRNLKNIRRASVNFSSGQRLTATAWDPSTDELLCAFGPAGEKSTITIRRWNKAQDVALPEGSLGKLSHESNLRTIASWDHAGSSETQGNNQIFSFQYFADEKTACLVLAGGDIILVREQPGPGEEEVEIVGSIDTGVTAAEWSPDEELLAIATRTRSLLFMTRDLESAGEIAMTVDDLKASKHVSVGWGSAETQFKGKRAKALRDPTLPENVDQGSLSPFDTGQVTISWRGDGALVAISTIDSDQRRVIRVFTREGLLDGVSEPVDGLEGALSWRPAGNIIAGIQRQENQIRVVFFERNGLRHGQFDLRLAPEDMSSWGSDIALKWNIDSSVLAVSFQDRVQLWTMGNYHYYMKQQIKFTRDDASRTYMGLKWHGSVPLRVAISLPGA